MRTTTVSLSLILAFGMTAAASPRAAAAPAHQDAADFLYREAEKHRRAGDLTEAIRELREVLILDPAHQQAKETLTQLERTAAAKRARAMDAVLSQVAQEQFTAPAEPVAAPVTVTVDAAEPASSGPSARVPDPRVNGVRWLYVFGRQGNPEYGALPEPQRIYVEVPGDSAEPVGIRVVDADLRGRRDELDGALDTSTVFRVLAGDEVLESHTVGPATPPGTTLAFGPYPAGRGKSAGGQAQFCLEAEGLEGNDNNLFAVEVSPPSAQCYSRQPAIRMTEERGGRMSFYPEVPEGASRVVVEQNYDLDPDGGRAEVIPSTRDGRPLKRVRVASSGSGAWSKTDIPVPPGADGARWTYRITKATQRAGNMSFRASDEQGRSLPVFFSRGGRRAAARPAEPVSVGPSACNVFAFDASGSSDPDRGELTYLWDFGDGAMAEGIRVEHAYADGGTYRVRLKVQDPTKTACCVSEVEQVLPVNLPPVPVIEGPETVCAGASAHFSAAKSTDTAGETLRYHWTFGDGGEADGPEADHVFADGGAHQVTLIVDDTRETPCSTAQAASTVLVNSPPVVRVNDAIRACAVQPTGPMEVAFSAAGSRDPDGDAVTVRWDFGDGTQGMGERVAHTYAQGGKYTAVATVDDGSGSTCSTATGVVPVQLNHPPVAMADLPSIGCPDALVTLHATKSSDADGQALTYTWDFGDGKRGEGATVQHAYPSSGAYHAALTVRDSSGMECDAATASVPVVINAPPVARMTIRGGRGLRFEAASDEVPAPGP